MLPCLSPAREALPRCSVLLLLTVLVPRRQLMSEQYMPGVKGVCVACKKPANKICAFSSCSNPTCSPCSTMVMLPDDRNLHYCVQHGVPAHHTIRMFNSTDSFNQARFGKSSSTVTPLSPALNIVSRFSDQHVSAPPGPYDVLPPVPGCGVPAAATLAPSMDVDVSSPPLFRIHRACPRIRGLVATQIWGMPRLNRIHLVRTS